MDLLGPYSDIAAAISVFLVVAWLIHLWTVHRWPLSSAPEFKDQIGKWMLHNRKVGIRQWYPLDPASCRYGKVLNARRLSPSSVEYTLAEQKIRTVRDEIVIPERTITVMDTDSVTFENLEFMHPSRFENLMTDDKDMRWISLRMLHGHTICAEIDEELVWLVIVQLSPDLVWFRISDGFSFGSTAKIAIDEFRISVKVVL